MTKRLAALIVCLVVAVAFVLRMRNPAELAMDAPGLRFFHALENRALTWNWNIASWLGSILFVGPLSIYLARRAVRWSRPDAWALVLSAIGASLVHSAIKMSLPRARPRLFPMLGLHPGEGTFPSGHAVNVTATFLSIALVASRVWPKHARQIAIASAFIIVWVGIGRLYLQVHWPSDVVAGWFIGAAWALLVDVVVVGSTMRHAQVSSAPPPVMQ
jgi:membrane-associated phospholipid phosphatase